MSPPRKHPTDKDRKRAREDARKVRRDTDPEYRAAFYARTRRYQMQRKYGISADAYEVLLQTQGGVCVICQAPPTGRRLAVDHCHRTGRVRGLLCGGCNRALGQFGDDPERMRKAAAYVESHR